jgi:hypothetical protein
MAEDGDGLQFEFSETPADGEGGAPVCAACQRPIVGEYWEINGQITCTPCRQAIGELLTGGSGLRRFLRAGAFGFVAAAIGTGIYYAILKLANLELSLISILVGYMVGKAVRAGSDHRGGWFYQLLAVFLTYASIVSCYIPFIIEGIKEGPPPAATSAEQPTEQGAASQAKEQPGPDLDEATPGQIVGYGLLAYLFVFVLACVAPFMAGAENLLGLVIIFFGLWQAWSLNRRPVLHVSGPHPLAEAVPAVVEEPTDEA